MLNRNQEIAKAIDETLTQYSAFGDAISHCTRIGLPALQSEEAEESQRAYATSLLMVAKQIFNYSSLDDNLSNAKIALGKLDNLTDDTVNTVIKRLGVVKNYLIALATKLGSIVDPKSQLSKETLNKIAPVIEKHLEEITKALPLAEETDTEEHDSALPSTTETAEVETEIHEDISDQEEASSDASEAPSENEIASESDADAEENASESESELVEQNDNAPEGNLGDILTRMQEKLNVKKEAIRLAANDLTDANKKIHAQYVKYKNHAEALEKRQQEIIKSIITRKSKRKELPQKIKEANEKALEFGQNHADNVATLKQQRAKFEELNSLELYLSELGKSLVNYQQADPHFDAIACEKDLKELEMKLSGFLDNENRRKKIEKDDVTKLIECAHNTYAPAELRKKNFLIGTAQPIDQAPSPESEFDPELNIENRKLLAILNVTRNNLKRPNDFYLQQLNNHNSNKNLLPKKDYNQLLKKINQLEIILDNLNQIEMVLQNYNFPHVNDFAREERIKSPNPVNNKDYGLQLVRWADLAAKRAQNLVQEDLENVQDDSSLAKKGPSFWQKLWRNKFTILLSLTGFLGGIALGYFTFGLSLEMTAASIATFVAAVGSTGIGTGVSHGLLGFVIDDYLAPDETPAGPEDDAPTDDLEDDYTIEEYDDETETENHDSGASFKQKREQKDVPVSGARNSFMKEDQNRRPNNDVVINIHANTNTNNSNRPR